MGKIIAIKNMQGGVGKTTTAINLSMSLAEKGKKVLLIDASESSAASSGLGIEVDNLDYSLYDVLDGLCTYDEAINDNIFKNLSVLPSNINLAAIEVQYSNRKEKEYLLKKAISSSKRNYDYIIIDSCAALGLIGINALVAADSIIIPVQCEYYAMEGLIRLMHTIELIRKKLNPSLYVEGVLFTMYDSRIKLSNEVIQTIKDDLKEHIFETIIPRDVKLAEAPSFGLPIRIYAPNSAGAVKYDKLVEEILGIKRI